MHLILVHSGSEFPTYINDCIAQIRLVSDIHVHVLIEHAFVSKIAPHPNLTVVSLDTLPEDFFMKNYVQSCRLDAVFRGGFWRATSLRFFYIHSYVKMNRLRDVFHIEYDNLIYQDFTKLLPAFQTKSMYCVLDAKDRGIASFVYWQDSEAIVDFLLSCLNAGARGENDMIALATHTHNNKENVGLLPIITPDYPGVDTCYSERLSQFGALFDGAAVGQYIGGVDPRNAPGDTCGFVNETTVFRCDRATVTWRTDSSGLRRPYLNGQPLVNLHIHSKDLRRWMSK